MRVLEELASLPESVKLVVVSNKSENLRGMFKSRVQLLPFQEWPRVVELMRESKIVINVQPFHIYGSHERLMTAMAHGAAVATDRNPYLEERFEDGQDLIFYEFTKGHLRKKLMDYLENIDHLRSVAQQGAEKVLKEDLAIHRAQDIIALVKRISSGEAGRRET
jgi:spore maturation protein CgeB